MIQPTSTCCLDAIRKTIEECAKLSKAHRLADKLSVGHEALQETSAPLRSAPQRRDGLVRGCSRTHPLGLHQPTTHPLSHRCQPQPRTTATSHRRGLPRRGVNGLQSAKDRRMSSRDLGSDSIAARSTSTNFRASTATVALNSALWRLRGFDMVPHLECCVLNSLT